MPRGTVWWASRSSSAQASSTRCLDPTAAARRRWCARPSASSRSSLVRSRSWDARRTPGRGATWRRSEEHTSELQSRLHLVCRLLLEKKKQLRSLGLASLPDELDDRVALDPTIAPDQLRLIFQ